MTGWGADADELDRLAAVVGQCGDVLDRNRSTLNGHVHHAPWKGQEADQFRHDWDRQYVPCLASAVGFLRSAQATLRANAEQQRTASSAGAGVGASVGGFLGSLGGAVSGLVSQVPRDVHWTGLMFPSAIPMFALGLMPGAMARLHLKEVRLGNSSNHILISKDGTISVKAGFVHSELTYNEYDSSFKAQLEGLGVEHTKDGAWGVLASPGVDIGVLKLSAGLDVTYNPHTGVIAPSGEYQVGLGPVSTDAAIHEQWNPNTGDLDKQVSMGGDVFGARHEVQAAEHNDQFVSMSTTDSLHVGPGTVSHTHQESVTADGSYVGSNSTTESVSASAGLDSTFFAIKTDTVDISHTQVSTTTAHPDGTRTDSNGSTSSGGW